ncbi:TetR/AcrR family transcriptional regulator [Nonomuraea zeae]|uniref:TetR/AcrR family transcriptional regulator n=1 Tax=Nonomuraea zeae TaxID=1642303 RepID=A0A5S4GN01_9ACTN|nr:TetR/AcrR family transcriptional regulator [Nonomuraea zeae]TMR34253.1 TetR/AcrR family transcriptional regulator [Nonomuraea zeae]
MPEGKTARRPMRKDTAQTRDRLLDAAGRLLTERGTAFTLPDLARASGVATATVYRHFGDVHDVHREFYYRLMGELVEDLEKISVRAHGRQRFEAVCALWSDLATSWGRAATHIRSAEGFLERVRRGDPPTSALYGALAPVLGELVTEHEIPEQNVEYAVLLWVTVFDERVIVDLSTTLGWSPRRIGRTLAQTVLTALTQPG